MKYQKYLEIEKAYAAATVNGCRQRRKAPTIIFESEEKNVYLF